MTLLVWVAMVLAVWALGMALRDIVWTLIDLVNFVRRLSNRNGKAVPAHG